MYRWIVVSDNDNATFTGVIYNQGYAQIWQISIYSFNGIFSYKNNYLHVVEET